MESVLRRTPDDQARGGAPVTVCGHKAPKHLFSVLGALLGVSVGVVFGFYDSVRLMSDVTHIIEYMVIVGLVYLIPQCTLAMVFKKPRGSRNIFKGMVAVPISYSVITTLVSNTTSLPVEQIASRVFALFLVSGFLTLLPGLISVYLSLLSYFLTGIDTCSLPDSRKFGYLIKPNKGSTMVLETLVSRSNFQIDRAQKEDGSGYVSASKDPLRLGIYYKMLNEAIDSTFILYEVEDETVRRPAQEDEALDFQAEMSGLLDSWKSRGKVEEYSLVRGSDIPQALQRVEDELGPTRMVKMPPLSEIKDRARSFPKNYPSWFSLFVGILSSIVSGLIVWLLTHSVK
jgi:hypothetical protein